jgi:hypothetical protein
MLLGHNARSGGVLPVVVTLTGWLMLIKGSMFLFLSPEAVYGTLLTGIHFEQLFYIYMAFVLMLGTCLTYAGFKSMGSSRARHALLHSALFYGSRRHLLAFVTQTLASHNIRRNPMNIERDELSTILDVPIQAGGSITTFTNQPITLDRK